MDGNVTYREDLAICLDEHSQGENDFIASDVFPVAPVNEESGKLKTVTRESLTQTADTKRSSRGTYNRISGSLGEVSYDCQENGLENTLDEKEKAKFRSLFDAELYAAKIPYLVLKRMYEKRVSSKIFDPATFTGADFYKDLAATKAWTDPTADAYKEVRLGIKRVKDNCGVAANAMVISDTTLERIKTLEQVVDSIKYTSRVTDAALLNALADYFGLDKILVGSAVENSAKKGKKFVKGDIWSDEYASLIVLPKDAEDLAEPATGRTILWTGDSPELFTVEDYEEKQTRGKVYRVRQNTDEKLIDPAFGFLMKIA